MAADITILPLTSVNEYVAGAIQNLPQFQLTTLIDDANIILAAGPTEEVGGFYYRVTGGDLAVTDAVGNGTVYILLLDDGDGTATAYLSTKSGEWDPNKGGQYINDASADDGAKVIFALVKSTGPIYSHKSRLLPPASISVPLGAIVGVHPDVLRLPNPYNFSPCDGVQDMPTANFGVGNSTKVPDLTDNRFLMGDTTYGKEDPVHNHQWYDGRTTSSDDVSYDSGGGEVFMGDFTHSPGGAGTWWSIQMTLKVSNTHLGDDAGAGIYTSNKANVKPDYFSVLFYMRIN